jgi:hypothetical protein
MLFVNKKMKGQKKKAQWYNTNSREVTISMIRRCEVIIKTHVSVSSINSN